MRRRDFIAAAAASAAAWPMVGHAQQPGKMRHVGVLMSFAVNGLRRDPLAVRKATLASLVAHAAPGLRLNEHLDHNDGQLVLEYARRLGLEGIVSKRRDSRIDRAARGIGSRARTRTRRP